MAVYDAIADFFIDKTEELKDLFPRPKPPEPKASPFLDFLKEKLPKKEPEDEGFVGGLKSVGEGLMYPFAYTGMGLRELGLGAANVARNIGGAGIPAREILPHLFEGGGEPSGGMLPGGSLYEEYRESPWWQQALAELPAWMLVPSATAVRAGMAAPAAAGGIKGAAAQAVRIAAAPMAGAEWLMASPFRYAGKLIGQKITAANSLKAFKETPIYKEVVGTDLEKPVLKSFRLGLRGKTDEAEKALQPYYAKVSAATPEAPPEVVRPPTEGIKPPTIATGQPKAPITPEVTIERQKQALIDYWTKQKIGKKIKPETWDENYIKTEYELLPSDAKVAIPKAEVAPVTPGVTLSTGKVVPTMPVTVDQSAGASWMERIRELDKLGAKDSEYRGIVSTASKLGSESEKRVSSGKSTWRSEVLRLAEDDLKRHPVIPKAPLPKKPAIQIGDKVEDIRGRVWEVLDNSDPSLLRVKSPEGVEARIGRKAIKGFEEITQKQQPEVAEEWGFVTKPELPIKTTASEWNRLSFTERQAFAEKVGLSKGIASNRWEDLLATQKEVLLGKRIPKAPTPATGEAATLRTQLEAAQAAKPLPGQPGLLPAEGMGAITPGGPAAPTPTGATKTVLDRISFEEPTTSFIEKIKTGWHRFNVAALDDIYSIRKYVDLAKKGGVEVSIDEDPNVWARMLKGNASKANAMLEDGTFGKQYWKMVKGKAEPNFTGESLSNIMKEVKEPVQWQDFSAYMVARRAKNLAAREIKTGLSADEATAAIAELEGKYANFPKLADRLYQYQDRVLQYANEMGLIGDDLLARLRKHGDYVPFYRVFEELQAKGFMGKKMANIASPIKRIKGSERAIVNPLESVVKNTHLIVHAADHNNVGIMLANLATKNPELAALFGKIPTPIAKVATVTAKDLGIKLEGLSDDAVEQVFNIFRPSMFTKENVASVIIDGKKQFFKVDPDLYKALLNLEQDSIGMLGKFFSLPAKWLRAGATLSPDFMIRNPARDQLTAFAYSNYGFVPGVDFLKGIASIVGKDKYYQLYKMSGAEHSMLVSIDRQYLRSTFKEIVEGKGFRDYIKHPLEMLQIVSELGEKGTRLGEFMKGIKAGALPVEAGFSSREVSLDFAKMGTTARAVNTLVAFFNANIRGWDRMITAFKEQPIRTSAKVFAGITVPSILLYAVNRNDPRWKEIPQWQKDLFWIVMTDDHIYRIPKPFELGIIFGSIPERFLEYMDNKDPDVFQEAIANAIEAGTPGFLPTALLPIVENWSNYSFFRDMPIVSASRKDMPPALQYGGTTSEMAKKLGELINYSPSKIDNLIQGWTGGLGRYATNALDGILKRTGISPDIPEPSPTLSDKPVIKAFVVRDPYGSSSASVDKFYKELENREAGERYLKEMLKLGEREKFEQYKAKHPEVMLFYDYSAKDHYSASARMLRRVARDMSEIRKKQQEVYNSKTMTPDQKRQVIDETNKIITELAQKALEAINKPDLMMKESSKAGNMPTSALPRELQPREGQSQWATNWQSVRYALTSRDLQALDRVWYKGQALQPHEEASLRKVHEAYNFGQKDFNIWLKQTLRQTYENAIVESKK